MTLLNVDVGATNRSESGDTDFLMKYQSIRLPLALKYSSLNNKAGTYFFAGPLVSHNMKSDQALYQTVVNEGIVNTTLESPNDFPDITLGAFIGAGYYKEFIPNRTAFIEFRYSSETGNDRSFKINTSGIQLLLGIKL